MYLAMLKKEFKQFFRTKVNIVMLIIFPIVLISTLAVGLKDMMDGESIFSGDIKDVVYYTMDDGNKYKEGFLEFSKAVSETVPIIFKVPTDIEKAKLEVDDYKSLAYLEFKGDKIDFYSSKKGMKTKVEIFKGVFDGFLREYATYETIGEFNKEAFADLVKAKFDSYVEMDSNKGKSVSAAEFYTFAELALIILFLGQTIGEYTYKEKQLKTINRINMSKSNHLMMLLSKISLGTIMGAVQTFLVYGYTSLVLDVDWGENTIKFLILFIVFGAFASIVGAIVGALAKNEGVVAGGLNVAIFFIGTLGGTFTPLSMILTIPGFNKLVYLSPIYWITTSTSTMICGIQTDAYYIALIIPIVLSLIAIAIYCLITKKRGGIVNA